MIHTRRASTATPCGGDNVDPVTPDLSDLRPFYPDEWEHCVQWDALSVGAWGTYADALQDLRAGQSIYQ
jgi:hypothetical protein